MYKYLILAIAAALVLAGPAQAKKPNLIKVPIDLYESFGPAASIGPAGFVVIEPITVNRAQPANSGQPVNISPDYSDTQIGWIEKEQGRKKALQYVILLKDTHIKQFVRDVITLAFNRAGYVVLSPSDVRSADAPRVNVEVTSLWMWKVPSGEAWADEQFHFHMETVIESGTPELANIGTVKGSGFRNGSRERSWRSYRTTALHSIEFFIDDFKNSVQTSTALQDTKRNASDDTSVANLSETISELGILRDAGTISEEEYEQLRKKAVEDAIK